MSHAVAILRPPEVDSQAEISRRVRELTGRVPVLLARAAGAPGNGRLLGSGRPRGPGRPFQDVEGEAPDLLEGSPEPPGPARPPKSAIAGSGEGFCLLRFFGCFSGKICSAQDHSLGQGLPCLGPRLPSVATRGLADTLGSPLSRKYTKTFPGPGNDRFWGSGLPRGPGRP